jgi:hypothetical protein
MKTKEPGRASHDASVSLLKHPLPIVVSAVVEQHTPYIPGRGHGDGHVVALNPNHIPR